jgi:para-aminobenzoate synthetase component 1
MPFTQSFPWIEPLAFARAVLDSRMTDTTHLALLYSGVQAGYSGRYSYVAFDPAQIISSRSLAAFSEVAATAPQDACWFGYLGYGLKDALETLPADTPTRYKAENLLMVRYRNVLRFDHELQKIEVIVGTYPLWVQEIAPLPDAALPAARITGSSMTGSEYLSKVATITENIAAGELYQANLTRKFYGEFSEVPSDFAVFAALCRHSPAAYSAFLRCSDFSVLSSSPEMFLSCEGKGCLRTRPVKGTAPRSADPAADEISRRTLENSAKDRAENLMIVDLMRNDLSRSCVPGSVQTSALFEINSHAQVHHMSSTITGTLQPGASMIDAIGHCFPPGSMTGAPKIRAMRICSELEGIARGIYSGALGWLNKAGDCELSVVIRTLILEGKNFEFQVGGGITFDSSPERERQETIDKARGILAALSISESELAI